MTDIAAIVTGARRVEARRSALQLRRTEQHQRRAEELGFSRPRVTFTALDGRRTWASVLTSAVIARASWARFDAAWLRTRDERTVLLVVDIRTGSQHAVELDPDELNIYLHGAEVMGARLRLFQPFQTAFRNARTEAVKHPPRITLDDVGQGDK